MDYQAFRSFRDAVVRARAVLRLDCMNPAQALARWRHAPVRSAAAADPRRGLAAWVGATGLAIAADRLAQGTGVRDLLAAALATLPGRRLGLPVDVYPVYWQIARAAGFAPVGFSTLAGLDLAVLADVEVVVVPVPLTPAGRDLRADELAALQAWLAGDPRRLLIVDAAYAYDHAALAPALGLLAGEQCVALFSCTKPWLVAEGLGVAAGPRGMVPALGGAPGPGLGQAVATLERQPELPALQQAAFRREWARLAPAVQAAVPGWSPPTTGYFAVVAAAAATLLADHDILAVPASVFGSARGDLSVVTCLHDLVEHEG